MNLLQLIFYSPIIISVLAILVFVVAWLTARQRRLVRFSGFLRKVFGWAFITGLTTFLVVFILSMVINSAQGPLAAIFVYGPLAFTVGALIGLGLWLATLRQVQPHA